MMSRSVSFLVCSLLFTGMLRADVAIIRSPAVIQHHTFDPKNPPKEMPKLHASETALTQSFFSSDAKVGGNVIETVKTPAGDFKASVKVGKIEMTLRMSVTIWVPENAMAKIINHEDGHRKIAEHFYDAAEPITRKEAEAMIGQIATGTGRDAQSAIDNAFDNVIQLACKKYLEKCEVPCGRAQEIYDQITGNGTNPVKEDKAVDEAVKRTIGDQ
jgi:hypothetical protein